MADNVCESHKALVEGLLEAGRFMLGGPAFDYGEEPERFKRFYECLKTVPDVEEEQKKLTEQADRFAEGLLGKVSFDPSRMFGNYEREAFDVLYWAKRGSLEAEAKVERLMAIAQCSCASRKPGNPGGEGVEADIICAWCGKYMGTKMVDPGSTPPGKKPATHGICEECFKKMTKGKEPGEGAT